MLKRIIFIFSVLIVSILVFSSCASSSGKDKEGITEKEETLVRSSHSLDSDEQGISNTGTLKVENGNQFISSDNGSSESGEPLSLDQSQSEATKQDSSEILSEDSSPSVSSVSEQPSSSAETSSEENTGTNNSETKAVWISYLEYSSIMTGKNSKTFSENINSMFSNLVDEGFNTVYVHARSHCDAYYRSDIFPWSAYITGKESSDPGYDPLEIMVETAHSYGLEIEAWINPYRVKGNSDTSKISSESPAYGWIGTDKVAVLSNGIYFNPADDDVINLIVSGVEEIVSNYDVDGIHFDDYFYPTTDNSFDRSYYSRYISSGGTMSLGDWRRDNVNKLIKKVYASVKNINPSCRFGISPSGSISQNYNILYCDVYAWTSQSGYIDYICPQIYYGFEHGTQPYQEVLENYNNMIKTDSVKLIVGLSAYKAGTNDRYAGSGSGEWIDNHDILSRQILSARNQNNYGGFALYRYDSLFNPESSVSSAVKAEREALKKVM